MLTKLTEQDKECKKIRKENKFLKATVNSLDSQIKKLMVACNELEQYARRAKGYQSQKEDTNKLVMKVGELVVSF